MAQSENMDKLIRFMEEETIALNIFAKKEDKLRLFIQQNDWENLNKCIHSMESMSDKIEKLGEERQKEFNRVKNHFGKNEDVGFYQIIVHLPAAQRDNCAKVYRELKLSVLKIQGITSSIDTYVRTVAGTMQQIINEIFPHRKGSIYCRKGNPKLAEENPMVLNRQL